MEDEHIILVIKLTYRYASLQETGFSCDAEEEDINSILRCVKNKIITDDEIDEQ